MGTMLDRLKIIEANENALREIMTIRDRDRREWVRHNFEARQSWLEDLDGFVKWSEESVATRDDEHLAWYTASPEGEPIPDHGLDADRIDSAIAQLERVRSITFGPTT